jgi:hypothetical protein
MDSVKGNESGQLYISYAIRTDCMQKHPQNVLDSHSDMKIAFFWDITQYSLLYRH